jgi:hypothetical protein
MIPSVHPHPPATAAVTTATAAEVSFPPTGHSSCAALVAELKGRQGRLPPGFESSYPAIRITLPVTCAMIPRDVCIAMKVYSCHPCDLYREVMDATSRYKGKSQQEYRRRYQCICPNKAVILQMPERREQLASLPSPEMEAKKKKSCCPVIHRLPHYPPCQCVIAFERERHVMFTRCQIPRAQTWKKM